MDHFERRLLARVPCHGGLVMRAYRFLALRRLRFQQQQRAERSATAIPALKRSAAAAKVTKRPGGRG